MCVCLLPDPRRISHILFSSQVQDGLSLFCLSHNVADLGQPVVTLTWRLSPKSCGHYLAHTRKTTLQLCCHKVEPTRKAVQWKLLDVLWLGAEEGGSHQLNVFTQIWRLAPRWLRRRWTPGASRTGEMWLQRGSSSQQHTSVSLLCPWAKSWQQTIEETEVWGEGATDGVSPQLSQLPLSRRLLRSSAALLWEGTSREWTTGRVWPTQMWKVK